MSSEELLVELEFTPNPNTLKYVTQSTLLEKGAVPISKLEEAKEKSPLAYELLQIEGVVGVMISSNFVTITIGSQDRLTHLNEDVISCMKAFLLSGKAALNLDKLNLDDGSKRDLNEQEKLIVKILDEEIRPSVAMDGGDISFVKFEEGYVYLSMQGSCANCPSSTATLKLGVENRLKQDIPEIIEVLAI